MKRSLGENICTNRLPHIEFFVDSGGRHGQLGLARLSRSSAKRQVAREDRDRAMEKHGAPGRLAQEDWHQLRGTHHRRRKIIHVRAS